MPSQLEIAVEQDPDDTMKGMIILSTKECKPSRGWKVLYDVKEEGPSTGSNNGLLKIIYTGLEETDEWNLAAYYPATAEISYQIVEDNGGNIITNDGLAFKKNSTYELFVFNDDENSVEQDVYEIIVSDSDIEVLP